MAKESVRTNSRTLLIEEVIELTGLKKSSIYNRLNPESKYFDPTFPKQVSRGGSTGVGWEEREVLSWMAARKPPKQVVKRRARSSSSSKPAVEGAVAKGGLAERDGLSLALRS